MRREEWRAEDCPECGAERERTWVLRPHTPGVTAIPAGARVEPDARGVNGGVLSRRTATPTRWVTLCLCDAP